MVNVNRRRDVSLSVLNWQEVLNTPEYLHYPLHPEEISLNFEGILGNTKLSEETNDRFAELTRLVTLKSNPAILLLTLKDRIEFD